MKNRIKEFRVIKGLSQEKLAVALHTTKQTISRLEKGIMPLTQEWMEKIADALGKQSHELINMEYSQSRPPIGGFGESGYTSPRDPRDEVFDMIKKWDRLTSKQQDDFLALAMLSKKESLSTPGGMDDGNPSRGKDAGQKQGTK